MITESSIFTDPNAHPLTLYLLCTKKMEADWTSWLSATLRSEIKRLFNSDISHTNLNKLQAIKTLHTEHHDAAWEEWEIFKNVILSLNGLPPSINAIQAPTTAELMNGVEIINMCEKHEFNDEVARFTAACLLHDDVHYAPPPLDFAQIYIAQPRYECHDCGKKGSALPPFERYMVCEECAAVYEGPKPFNFKAKEEGGHNLTFSIVYDPGPIKRRYEELIKQKEPFIKEEGDDIQSAKLIIAHDYLLLKLKEFEEQIHALGLKTSP